MSRSAGVCWLARMQSSEIWASSQPPPAAVGASSSLTISGMEVRSLCGLDRCESVVQRTGAGQCGDGEHWQTSGVWRGPSLLAAAAAALSFEFLGIHGQLTGRGLGRGALQGKSAVS
jgi:hypothetical protein